MKRIDSRVNTLYRRWKSLLSSNGIKEEHAVLISGRKLVPEFLAARNMRHQCLIVSDPKDVEKLQFHQSLEVVWLKKDLFDEIDEAGTHFPILVVEAPNIPTAELHKPPQKGLEIVLAMSNPLNLGATLRSCEAFSATQITLLKECANPFLPKVLRASSGSALRVPLTWGPSISSLTNREAEFMWALDVHGEPLHALQWPKNVRLFIGEEGRGIPKELSFQKQISIPIKEGMDSLNALAATSIALYDYHGKVPRSF